MGDEYSFVGGGMFLKQRQGIYAKVPLVGGTANFGLHGATHQQGSKNLALAIHS